MTKGRREEKKSRQRWPLKRDRTRNGEQGGGARLELQVEGERGEVETETEIRKAGGGVASSSGRTLISVHRRCFFWGETAIPSPRRERKERNVYKEGRKKKWSEEEKWRKSGGKREGGARRQRGGIGLRVKRGESEQRHCRINIPFV